jgi:hypothetical protein
MICQIKRIEIFPFSVVVDAIDVGVAAATVFMLLKELKCFPISFIAVAAVTAVIVVDVVVAAVVVVLMFVLFDRIEVFLVLSC